MRHKSNLDWTEANRLISINTEDVRSNQLCAEPLVSVCLITYNHREFFRQAIDSVLMQRTEFSFEIIIGDDGSIDGTTDTVLDYHRRFPEKIRVLLAKENLGKQTGNGRLNGIRTLRACRGKYIAFLEGDDYWTDSKKLQKQVEFLESNPDYAGAFHDTSILDADGAAGNPRSWWQDFGARLDVTLEDTISRITPFHTSSFVFRRENLSELPTAILQCESGDLVAFILSAARGPLRRIPAPMSTYRKHYSGITNTSEHQGWGGWIQKRFMFCALRRHLYPVGKEQFDEVIKQYDNQLFSLWIHSGDAAERLALLQSAWRNHGRYLVAQIMLRSILFSVKSPIIKLRRAIGRRIPNRLKRRLRSMVGSWA
ncbi:MAG: glycosyltransferase [Deltaproteobacteria bacterium]|nr:glycosyltransferase [Deltaproteobacteria bacterium]